MLSPTSFGLGFRHVKFLSILFSRLSCLSFWVTLTFVLLIRWLVATLAICGFQMLLWFLVSVVPALSPLVWWLALDICSPDFRCCVQESILSQFLYNLISQLCRFIRILCFGLVFGLLSISGTEIFSATLSISLCFDSFILSVGRGRIIPARQWIYYCLFSICSYVSNSVGCCDSIAISTV